MNYVKVLWDLYKMKRNEKKSSAQMKELQDKKLRKLLSFAWEHSEYYRRAYETKGQESDSEGQLVVYEQGNYAYRIFLDDLSGYRTKETVINPGELIAPVSLRSMFGVEIGDEISFPIARNGVEQTFKIKGWFEDPFMGSSMIGMKSF